jgi:hypothetical protein
MLALFPAFKGSKPLQVRSGSNGFVFLLKQIRKLETRILWQCARFHCFVRITETEYVIKCIQYMYSGVKSGLEYNFVYGGEVAVAPGETLAFLNNVPSFPCIVCRRERNVGRIPMLQGCLSPLQGVSEREHMHLQNHAIREKCTFVERHFYRKIQAWKWREIVISFPAYFISSSPPPLSSSSSLILRIVC